MVAPQLGNGVHVLLAQPDHVGTQVLMLGIFLLLERAPRRWYTPIAIWVLLVVAVVADKITIVDAVVPLAFVGLLHAIWTRQPSAGRFELSLAVAAGAALATAKPLLTLISRIGGFTLLPVQTALTTPRGVVSNLLLAWHGILSLFGADVTAAPPGPQTVLAWLHAPGSSPSPWPRSPSWRGTCRPSVTSWATCSPSGSSSTWPGSSPASSLPRHSTRARSRHCSRSARSWQAGSSARSFSRPATARPPPPSQRGWPAVGTAPRQSMAPLAEPRQAWGVALAVAGACQLAALGYGTTQPPAAEPEQALAAWLAAHRLTSGLGTFTEGNLTTLDSGDTVRLLTVSWVLPARSRPSSGYTATPTRGPVKPPRSPSRAERYPRLYQSSASWYDPRTQYASFVVMAPVFDGAVPST